MRFRPGPEHHILDTLSIRIPRCEDYTRVRKDRRLAFEARLSSLDGAGCFEPGGTDRELLRYSGAEPLELAPGDGVLVPVEREVQSSADGSLTEAVFLVDCGVEAVPGLWTTGAAEGFVFLAAQELDHTLEPGDVVAEIRSGLVETAACDCGAVETNFLSVGEEGPCETCGVAKAPELSDGCFSCGSVERTAVRSYQECSSCSSTRGRRSLPCPPSSRAARTSAQWRTLLWLPSWEISPENSWWDAPGGVASVWPTVTCLLQRSGEAWRLWDTRDLRSGPSVALSGDVPVTERLAVFRTRRAPKWAGWVKGSATSGLKGSAAARDSSAANTASNPSYHIVESWDIEKMMEEPPTDYYYDRLSEDLRKRHPQADSHLIDHLVSLEAFLDKSILFGFSFGINKAEVAVAEGKLLGHKIGRSGSSPDEERCQAVVDFPPLREKLPIQQFLGCANWLRGYLPAEYGHAAKVLGQWQKPGAEFPEGGLGAGATAGCKAFKAIKQMMQRHICLASFDEAAAADGSCPIEQIADASGIAVGGSVLQMTRDLSRVKVLMTHSKSLTPAQQNWPPLIQEAFAQLEVKRATRRTFGSIRTVCWTDHANLTRAQTSDIGLDPKLVRWVGEILLDGSEIRSLSGRSATLGDSFSRNPKDRDRLLEARTRDLQGMSGRLRGFDLDQYLEEGTEGTGPVPWAVGSDAVPDTAASLSR